MENRYDDLTGGVRRGPGAMRISQELSCQGNVNVQNTEARNVFTERSEHGPLRPVRSRGERSFILMHACLFFMGPPPNNNNKAAPCSRWTARDFKKPGGVYVANIGPMLRTLTR